MQAAATISSRNAYQEKRFRFLRRNISRYNVKGLEIGACHLPTVPSDFGICRFADFRTADEMASLWHIDRHNVCDVDYVISRDRKFSEQIHDRFDYVIACHVIEHVPNPIGYINDLAQILNPGGLILLSVPDMRMTPDRTRPIITIDHLLMDFYNDCKYPSLEHILEFHRHSLNTESPMISTIDAYRYAVEYLESGMADVHCHAWTDDVFRKQFDELCHNGIIEDLHITDFEETKNEFNEFSVIFSKS